eukprot:7587702-Pyramimonas_sp.AAC.1
MVPPACAPAAECGTPPMRFVAPQGAPPKARRVPPACALGTYIGTSAHHSRVLVAPHAPPPKAP